MSEQFIKHPEKAPPEIAAYKSVIDKRVEWGDMDGMGHVNNTRYFYYTESARLIWFTDFYKQLGSDPEVVKNETYALAETSCRFKVSLTFPDTVLITTGVNEIADNYFTMRHLIYSVKLSRVAAQCEVRMVRYNFHAGARVNIPEDEVVALNKYLI